MAADASGRGEPSRPVFLLKRMQSIREGGGSLPDNCIMMWGSGLEDGNKHTRVNLPFIVAGRGGGTINTGRQPRNLTPRLPRPVGAASARRRVIERGV